MSDYKIANLRRENLKNWLDDREIRQTDLANRLGRSRSYISLLFSPDRHFGEKAARFIEQTLHMPDGELDRTKPGTGAVSEWTKVEDLDPGVYALVPRTGVRLSAGGGAVAEPMPDLPPLAFRQDWLRGKSISARSNLRIATVAGDSMEPYLLDGDTVMIDLGQKAVADGNVYAISYGNELRVKRLRKRFDGGLIIQSDNPHYAEETLTARDAGAVRVLGRVLWRAG